MYMTDTDLGGLTDWLQSAGKAVSGWFAPTVAAPAAGTVNAPGATVPVAIQNGATVKAPANVSALTKTTPLPSSSGPIPATPVSSNVPPASAADVFGRFVSVLGEAVSYSAQANQPLSTNVGAPTNLSDIPGSSPVATMAVTPPSGSAPTSPPVTALTRSATMPATAGAPALLAPATPAWVMPAAIGGGALLLLLMLGKKRRA